MILQQQVKEQDGWLNPDDLVRNRVVLRTFVVTGTQTLNLYQMTTNTERGNEDMFHQVRIRVSVGGGSYAPWSAWDKSPAVSVAA